MLEDRLARLKDWHLIALALLLAVIAFAPHVGSSFVGLDDGILIKRNLAVQRVSLWSYWTMFTTYDPELYIPLTLLSYHLEHAIFGLNPTVFHTTNLLLHLGSTALLFAIAKMLTGNRLAAFLTAALFAVHPLNTEAVMWAAARKDTLSAFLFFLSLLLYLRFQENGSRRSYAWSVVTFLLGLMAKVSIVALPVILLLVDRLQGRPLDRAALREKIPFFALSVVFGIIALLGKTQNIASSTPLETFLLAGKSTAFSLGKLLWPSRLSVLYQQMSAVDPTSPEFLLPLGLSALLACVVVFAFVRRKHLLALGTGWFLLLLIPSYTNFYKNGSLYFASDRYVYIAGVGVVLLASIAVVKAFARLRSPLLRGGVLAAVASILIASTAGSYVQARTWKNDESLYRGVLARDPDSTIALNNLGSVLYFAGRLPEAEELLLRALALDPDLPEAHLNMGLLRKSQGRYEEAMVEMRRAGELAGQRGRPSPDDMAPYYFLGETLDDLGRTDEAIQTLQLATQKGPEYPEAWFNLGIKLQKRGRTDEAITAIEKAIAIDPMYLRAHYHLAAVYAERGRLPDAKRELEFILRFQPQFEKAAEHLERIKGMLGE